MAEEDTFSAKQVARRIGTDPKTFRKFLRSPASPYEPVGQGRRYEFAKVELRDIDKAFHEWHDKPKMNGHIQVSPEAIKTMQEIASIELPSEES